MSMLVLARFGLALSLGLARGISSAHSSYYLVLNARFTCSTSQDLSSGFVTRTSPFSEVYAQQSVCVLCDD